MDHNASGCAFTPVRKSNVRFDMVGMIGTGWQLGHAWPVLYQDDLPEMPREGASKALQCVDWDKGAEGHSPLAAHVQDLCSGGEWI